MIGCLRMQNERKNPHLNPPPTPPNLCECEMLRGAWGGGGGSQEGIG